MQCRAFQMFEDFPKWCQEHQHQSFVPQANKTHVYSKARLSFGFDDALTLKLWAVAKTVWRSALYPTIASAVGDPNEENLRG